MIGMELDANGLEVLGRSICLDLLGTVSIGRVGLCIDALPVVLPVAFAVHEDDVVICAMAGRRITEALDEAVVAFQADGRGGGEGIGWSVLVQGPVRVLPVPPPVRVSRHPHRRVWGAGAGAEDQFAAIRTDLVRGRRVP